MMGSLTHTAIHFLNYKSPKLVEVRSLKLGLISKLMLFCIFLYIIVYQILYENRHLHKSVPMGIVRMQLQRPTKGHCNPNDFDCEADFTPIADLQYCLSGSEKQEHGKSRRLPCLYMDEKEMQPTGFEHFTVMVPTRITTYHQRASHNCGPTSSSECKNVYTFNDSSTESVFVADIERFTLLIETAFTLPTEDLQRTPVLNGASNDFPGYWEVCADAVFHQDCTLEKIPCLTHGCDHPDSESDMRSASASASTTAATTVTTTSAALSTTTVAESTTAVDEANPAKSQLNFFGLPWGDVVSMGSLLQMAGVDLDNQMDENNDSRRTTGVALQIDVEYENRVPFKWPVWRSTRQDIRYVYHATVLPFKAYKEVSEEVSSDREERRLVDKHGVFVHVNIRGSVHFFDLMTMLLILTTGLSLIASANTGVDFFARNVWGERKEYKRDKIDVSRNFDTDDTVCFCSPVKVPNFDDAPNQDLEYYAKYPQDFTEDLRRLDSDTLKCAGILMTRLHEHHSGKRKNFIREEMDQAMPRPDLRGMSTSSSLVDMHSTGLGLPDAAQTLLS